jgi:N-methylhydantoinase A
LSRHAVAQHLSVTGLSPEDAAFAVTEMVDENMANAARVHAVENGRDIEAFTMIAFGGGAPLHACRLAEKLGLSRVLIPPGAGVGSALGFMRAPFSFEATRGLYQRLDSFDAEQVNSALADMETEARGFVAQGTDQPVTARLVAQMRYVGQGWEIPVELDKTRFEDADAAGLHAAFETAYAALFGRVIEGLSVEVTNWGLTLSTPVAEVAKTGNPPRPDPPKADHRRPLFDAGLRQTVSAAVLRRSDLRPGHRVSGPAVITEDETSTIVTAGFDLMATNDGALLLTRKETTP